jgi:hypothetical protein
VPPPQSPNPFARPSPWGNLPATKISLARRPAGGRSAEPPPVRKPGAAPSAAILSGFSVPPPRARPAVAPEPASFAEPEAFAFTAGEAADIPLRETVAPMAVEPPPAFQPLPYRPARRHARRRAPTAIYAIGGVAVVAVVALGVAAISLGRRAAVETATPVAAAPPPSVAAPVAAPPVPLAVAGTPAPEVASAPAPRPVAVAPRPAPARTAVARAEAAPPVIVTPPPADTAPLLAVSPPEAAPKAAAPAPAPIVRPPVDPEAPIPTRSRTPD